MSLTIFVAKSNIKPGPQWGGGHLGFMQSRYSPTNWILEDHDDSELILENLDDSELIGEKQMYIR